MDDENSVRVDNSEFPGSYKKHGDKVTVALPNNVTATIYTQSVWGATGMKGHMVAGSLLGGDMTYYAKGEINGYPTSFMKINKDEWTVFSMSDGDPLE